MIFIHNIHILSNTYFPKGGGVATPVTPLDPPPGLALEAGSLAPDPARVFIVFIRHSSDSTAANPAELENFRAADRKFCRITDFLNHATAISYHIGDFQTGPAAGDLRLKCPTFHYGP